MSEIDEQYIKDFFKYYVCNKCKNKFGHCKCYYGVKVPYKQL